MATVTLSGLGGVDTRDFKAFAKALAVAAPMIRKELILNLRAVGAIVAEEAKVTVSPFSRTIPDSIKVRVSGATVSVVAGGAGVPLGALFETGNVGKRGGDTFNHPVFGNRATWVAQPMHPYLGPALISKIDAVEVAAVEALDRAIGLAVTL